MSVSLIIPYIADSPERLEIVQRCVHVARRNSTLANTEFVLLNNGPMVDWDAPVEQHIHNHENIGVLPSFVQGFEYASGSIHAFIHSDVLLHEEGWDERIWTAFYQHPDLGLAGLFGGKGLTPDGHRHDCMSNMLGKEWGACGCHEPTAWHHSNLMTGFSSASMLDGVGMFFSYDCLEALISTTDAFAEWRAPHHFYDRILALKTVEAGWDVGVIGIGFDHWSGATAGGSKVYEESAIKWLKEHGHEILPGQIPDQAIYNLAERQFFEEYSQKLPLFVDNDWNYTWRSGT